MIFMHPRPLFERASSFESFTITNHRYTMQVGKIDGHVRSVRRKVLDQLTVTEVLDFARLFIGC